MNISKLILPIAYFFISTISGEIVESGVACNCMDLNDPHINHCDDPQGFQKCQVFTNQTCPDMFCDDSDRCFSVLACPSVPFPVPIPCDGCECMDKQAPKCLNDPLGQCNKCQRPHPLSICRVPVDSKCVDKFCFEEDRCYAVTACDCESTPTASPTASPTIVDSNTCFAKSTDDNRMECANGNFVDTPPETCCMGSWNGCMEQGSFRVRCPLNTLPCDYDFNGEFPCLTDCTDFGGVKDCQ